MIDASKLAAGTILGSLAFVLAASPAKAEETIDTKQLLNLSLDQLSNIEVTSVSKHAEKESEAAAAIYVITQDDIRHSGMTAIPELLRMVPGLDVAQSGAHQWSISSRGLSGGQFADTLLVLIDGRTVYTPLNSGVYWDVQDVPLQDIERIEVIRGPGATLWGANAVNGVINIITKSSRDTVGGFVSESAGNQIHSETVARYGAKIGDDAYARVYAKYDDDGAFRNMNDGNAHDAWNKAQSGFRSDWQRDNQSFTLQGDVYHAGEDSVLNLLQLSGATTPGNFRDVASGANILGRWDDKFSNTSDLTLQMYYDDARRDNFIYYQNIQTLDFDLQHTWNPTQRQEIVWGTGYRLVKSDAIGNAATALGVPYVQLNPQSRSDNLFSAFLQDKITLHPNDVFLTLGSKLEHNDYTGFEIEPSARLSWLLNDRQTLWSSVSRAVRTPNIALSDSQVIAGSAGFPTVYLAQVSNPQAMSEELTAYELGYRIQPTKTSSVDVAAFYNSYNRLLTGVLGSVPFTEFSPALGGNLTLFPVTPVNLGTAHTYGAETTGKWNPTQSIELAASYTLLEMDFSQPDPYGYAYPGKSPQQQFNARATFQLPHNVEFTTAAYYVDPLTALDANTGAGIPSYTRVDARLAWKPLDNLELSVVGQNLLDNMHQEFAGFIYQNSSQVPRTVYGNITWKF